MGIKIIDGEDGDEEEILYLKHHISDDESLTPKVLNDFYENAEVELDGFRKPM